MSVYFVYIFYFVTVDGGWSEWYEFAPCSAPKCGIGKKMLERFCSNPSPENGGQFCVGSRIKTEACQDICPGTHYLLILHCMYSMCCIICSLFSVVVLLLSVNLMILYLCSSIFSFPFYV